MWIFVCHGDCIHTKCYNPQALPVGTDDGALSLRERDPGANWLEESLFPGPGSVLFWRVSSLTFQKLPSKDAQFDCAVTSDSGARRRPDLTH